ncbi:MAG: arginine decarboxylase, pyruvoyl-dependent [Firmicutes bacterium]|nr:arginine decarboxylase, pyruvoyl-dependent [Bacillota bacterium]
MKGSITLVKKEPDLLLTARWQTPDLYALVAGSSEGQTFLTAFDGALLAAGVGNVNLLRVSSILPPGSSYRESIALPPGSLVPIAYASTSSDVPGTLISAAVGVGVSEATYGVIMEFSGRCSAGEAGEYVAAMVREAFQRRELRLADLKVRSVEHRVEGIGCVFAGVPLWYAGA